MKPYYKLEDDETFRDMFYSRIWGCQDQEAFDEDGEYNLAEDDFWNSLNPDYLDISDKTKEKIRAYRKEVQDAGKEYKLYVDKFFKCWTEKSADPNETLQTIADMIIFLDAYKDLESFTLSYSENITTIESLEKTIAELKPLAKKCPGLEKTIERLEKEKDELGKLYCAERLLRKRAEKEQEALLPLYITIGNAARLAHNTVDVLSEAHFKKELQTRLNGKNGIIRHGDKRGTTFYALKDIVLALTDICQRSKSETAVLSEKEWIGELEMHASKEDEILAPDI